MHDSPDDLPVVNASILEELRLLAGCPFLQNLIESFLRTTPERIAAMREAGQQGDLRSVAEMAHILISSAGNLGAMRFSAAARALEQEARSANTKVLGRIEALQELFLEVRARLESARQKLEEELS